MEEEKPKIRLRPVVYTTNHVKKGAQNTAQQMFLLKALQVTQDPKKLKEMIGVKTVAEVYRTLDKMAMRKEYHEALAKSGISFDFIVKGLKNIAMDGFKDADKLKALQTLLKSVGMDTYKEDSGGGSGSWEEVLLEKINEQKELGSDMKEISDGVIPTYEVIKPEIPESARLMQEDEDEITSSIYDVEPKKHGD